MKQNNFAEVKITLRRYIRFGLNTKRILKVSSRDVAIFSPRNVQIEPEDHDFVLEIFIMRSNRGGVLVFEKNIVLHLEIQGSSSIQIY
jgi:hypothetical protein